jgi:DNA polymerase-1
MKKILLIDGMSAAYRAFYAIRSLSTSRRQPTNAVYGFIRMLKKILKDYGPDRVVVAGDSRGPTFRHLRFKDYKATRKPMPDDLSSQIPLIQRAAEGYGIPWIAVPGYEADDILATLAREASAEGDSVFILTGDKDLLQLVNDRIKVISPHGDGTLFDEKAVRETFGVEPERIPDILALMGDAIDNVPGVPGVGEKTAVALIRDYRTLEGVLAHADEVKNARVRESLKRFADQARVSRELTRLDAAVPLASAGKDLSCREPSGDALRDLFRELEFSQLLRELPPEKQEEVVSEAISGAGGAALFRERLAGAGECAIFCDVEDGHFMDARLLGLAVCREKGRGCYLPLDGEAAAESVRAAAEFLSDPAIGKAVHDAKAAAHACLNSGLTLRGIVWDGLLASYLRNPSRPDHDLAGLAREQLSRTLPERAAAGELNALSSRAAAAVARASAVAELREKFSPLLDSHRLSSLLRDMDIPLSSVLVGMERTGMAIDRERLQEMSSRLSRRLDGLTREMHDLAGEEFNLNSPKQLAHILFEKLQLPKGKKIKTGYSTDVKVLTRLSAVHELPAKILAFRQLFKLKSTYIDSLPALVNPRTGRIHTTFNQAVTATGRLSSANPNLQNIPIRTEIGNEIRKAFVPRPEGRIFVAADYSQIDLRVLAHLSGDPLLLEAFSRDQDIHAFTASQIFGVPLSGVTEEMRRRAKTVNFGIIYGMGPFGLAEDLGITLKEAELFIREYFQRYRGVEAYIRSSLEEAKKKGYVVTLFQRRRYLPELMSEQINVRRFGERTAINTPIQGSAADIIKLAMIEIDRRIAGQGLSSRPLLQIHDELLFEGPEGEAGKLVPLVRSAMESAAELKVRLKVSVSAGKSWGELESWTGEGR